MMLVSSLFVLTLALIAVSAPILVLHVEEEVQTEQDAVVIHCVIACMRQLFFLREDLDQLLEGINIDGLLKGFLKLVSVDTFNKHLKVLNLRSLVFLHSLEFLLVFLLLDVELRFDWDLGR